MKISRLSIVGVFILMINYAYANNSSTKSIPPIFDKHKIQDIVHKINANGLKVCPVCDEVQKPDVVQNVDSHTGNFYINIDESTSYRFYEADLNNDGEKKYVLVSQGGAGQFFDIEAVYKKQGGKFKNIYEQIKLPFRRLLRDEDGGTYDLEDGYIGMSQGDILITEESGKIYFMLIEASGKWSELQPDLKTQKWVKESYPKAHKYIWDDKGLRHIGTKKISFIKKLDPLGRVLVEYDPIFQQKLFETK